MAVSSTHSLRNTRRTATGYAGLGQGPGFFLFLNNVQKNQTGETRHFLKKQRRFDENEKSMQNKLLKQYFLLQMSAIPGFEVEKKRFCVYSIAKVLEGITDHAKLSCAF